MQETNNPAAASTVEFSQIAPDVTAGDFLSGRTGIVLGLPVPPGASGTAGGIVSKAGRSPTSRRRGARRSPG